MVYQDLVHKQLHLGAGGYVAVGPPYNALASTESFNGSTWTSVNSMNTGKKINQEEQEFKQQH
jgi:hypothetical protein